MRDSSKCPECGGFGSVVRVDGKTEHYECLKGHTWIVKPNEPKA